MFPLKSRTQSICYYSQLSKKEAQQHFDWFLNQISSRIDQLKDYSQLTLNYSPNCLEELWGWFMYEIEISNKTENELMTEYSQTEEWLKQYIPLQKVSVKSLSITMDISIYFGELIRVNHSDIDWGIVYNPKSFASVNRPVLRGFTKNTMDVVAIWTTKYLKSNLDYKRISFFMRLKKRKSVAERSMSYIPVESPV